MNREDRNLLAAVSKWARTNGWACPLFAGRQNDASTIQVDVFSSGIYIKRRESANVPWPAWSTQWPVETVQEGVDVLCALRILPAEFSSQFYAGAESMDEWSPLPLIPRSDWVRRFAAEAVSA